MAHMEVLGDSLLSQNMSTQPQKNVFFLVFSKATQREELCSAPVSDDVNSLITLLKKERNVLPFFFLKELGNILPQDEERIVQIYSWNGALNKRRPKKDFDRSKFQKCCNRTILTCALYVTHITWETPHSTHAEVLDKCFKKHMEDLEIFVILHFGMCSLHKHPPHAIRWPGWPGGEIKKKK